MKNIVIILGVLLLSSCSEEFLNADIAVNRPIESFYKTPEEIEGALFDAYNVLQREQYVKPRFIFGDMASDNSLKGGSSIADYADVEEIVEFRPLASNGVVNDLWVNAYASITKANVIIDKITNGTNFENNQNLKEWYLAEAKFLRAFGYWYVVRVFGEAPLLTEGITDYTEIDPKKLVKKPTAEIWALIEQDLTDAIAHLPTKSTLAEKNGLGRATKGAAQAMLANGLMFQNKYNEAVVVLKDLIDSGEYSLLNDFGALWRPEGEFGSENIFEINYLASDSGWGEDCEGSIRNVYQMSRDDWGWGFNQPTQDLVNAFETGDPRIIYTINWPGDEYQEGIPQKNSQNNVYGYSSRKAFLLPTERPGSASCGGQNEVIFRLGDIYLLYAEALVKSGGNSATALSYVNKVRERANTTPKTDPERLVQAYTVSPNVLPMLTYSTDDQLFRDILHERRVELAMEGHRWWDLIRNSDTDYVAEYYQKWGIEKGYADDGDLKGRFYKEWISKVNKPVWPIPQSEIDASQGNLKQTDGY